MGKIKCIFYRHHRGIDSVYVMGNKVVGQSYDSYRCSAFRLFVLNGKKVGFVGYDLCVEGDELDNRFFEMAKTIPARRYKVWKAVCKMLLEGAKKEDTIKYLSAQAIAEGLKNGGSRD